MKLAKIARTSCLGLLLGTSTLSAQPAPPGPSPDPDQRLGKPNSGLSVRLV